MRHGKKGGVNRTGHVRTRGKRLGNYRTGACRRWRNGINSSSKHRCISIVLSRATVQNCVIPIFKHDVETLVEIESIWIWRLIHLKTRKCHLLNIIFWASGAKNTPHRWISVLFKRNTTEIWPWILTIVLSWACWRDGDELRAVSQLGREDKQHFLLGSNYIRPSFRFWGSERKHFGLGLQVLNRTILSLILEGWYVFLPFLPLLFISKLNLKIRGHPWIFGLEKDRYLGCKTWTGESYTQRGNEENLILISWDWISVFLIFIQGNY